MGTGISGGSTSAPVTGREEKIRALVIEDVKIIEREKITTGFSIVDPVGYFDMLELLKNCKLVLTDSGGLQKEAYCFNKYCITLRNETEWVELVQNNFNRLAGSDTGLILELFQKFSNLKFDKHIELYGGGKASGIIAKTLAEIS